jgi:hypothetical protein
VTEAFAAGEYLVIDHAVTPKTVRKATTTDTGTVQLGIAVAAGDSLYLGTDGKL